MIDWISFSLTRWPYASSSSARTRRHPYVQRGRSCISRITSVSHPRRIARSHGSTLRHRKNPDGATRNSRHTRLVPWPSRANISTMPNSAFGRTTRPSTNNSDTRLTVASSDSSSTVGRHAGAQLCGFGGRRAREFAPVDTILANPPIHRCFRDLDGRGDVDHPLSRTDLLDDPCPELRRICVRLQSSKPSDCRQSRDAGQEIGGQISWTTKRGPVTGVPSAEARQPGRVHNERVGGRKTPTFTGGYARGRERRSSLV